MGFDGLKAHDIYQEIKTIGGNVQKIGKFTNAQWSGYLPGLEMNNFTISSGQCYLIQATNNAVWKRVSPIVPSPFHLNLNTGWNFISLPPWAGKTFTAQALIDEFNKQGGYCKEIYLSFASIYTITVNTHDRSPLRMVRHDGSIDFAQKI